MDYFALHSAELVHKCILPFSVLDSLLADGIELKPTGFLCAITALDDEGTGCEGMTVVLGMERFSEKGDINCIVLPTDYLPTNSFVKLNIIHEHQYADKMVLQVETDEFAKEADPESILVTYIQSNVPVINTGTVLDIAGHKLHVVSLWKGETPLSYTSTLNHDLPVEFVPSMETEKREAEYLEQAINEAKIKAEEEAAAAAEAARSTVTKPSAFTGKGRVLGGQIATTREERLAVIRKRLMRPPEEK